VGTSGATADPAYAVGTSAAAADPAYSDGTSVTSVDPAQSSGTSVTTVDPAQSVGASALTSNLASSAAGGVATSVSDLSGIVTSTVYSTTEYTITSCAASVANCPASYQSQQVVTKTVDVSIRAPTPHNILKLEALHVQVNIVHSIVILSLTVMLDRLIPQSAL
jgi:hypothetical protein